MLKKLAILLVLSLGITSYPSNSKCKMIRSPSNVSNYVFSPIRMVLGESILTVPHKQIFRPQNVEPVIFAIVSTTTGNLFDQLNKTNIVTLSDQLIQPSYIDYSPNGGYSLFGLSDLQELLLDDLVALFLTIEKREDFFPNILDVVKAKNLEPNSKGTVKVDKIIKMFHFIKLQTRAIMSDKELTQKTISEAVDYEFKKSKYRMIQSEKKQEKAKLISKIMGDERLLYQWISRWILANILKNSARTMMIITQQQLVLVHQIILIIIKQFPEILKNPESTRILLDNINRTLEFLLEMTIYSSDNDYFKSRLTLSEISVLLQKGWEDFDLIPDREFMIKVNTQLQYLEGFVWLLFSEILETTFLADRARLASIYINSLKLRDGHSVDISFPIYQKNSDVIANDQEMWPTVIEFFEQQFSRARDLRINGLGGSL